MTENAINYQRNKEVERSNREQERQGRQDLERKEYDSRWKRTTDTINAGGSLLGNIFKGITGLLNDANWYGLDKQMVKDVTGVSFNTPLGNMVKFPFTNRIISGIMAVKLAHTIGDADAANSAAKNIYAYIRQANSGSKNYEPNDIFAYLFTMCDAFSYHGYMTRLLALLNKAKGHNKYYFDAMIKACGGDPTSLRANIAQFRAYINSYGMRLNAFYVPKDLSLFQRRYWLYSTIFKDNKVKKSQEYVFVPYELGIYDDTTSTLKAIRYDQFTDAANTYAVGTFEALKAFGDRIINTLLSSSDIGIMSGDILKAYGPSGVHSIPSIPENVDIESAYSEEVLSQIHNATLLGELNSSTPAITTAQFDIHCPAGGTISQGYYVSTNRTDANAYIFGTLFDGVSAAACGPEDGVLNMYKDDPTPDDIMVATRLSVGSENRLYDSTYNLYEFNSSTQIHSDKAFYFVKAHGTEVAINAIIYTLNNDGTIAEFEIKSSFKAAAYSAAFSSLNNGMYNSMKRTFDIFNVISFFDYAPYIYVYDSNYFTTSVQLTMIATNVDAENTATVSAETLKNMHYTAVLSEFGVPLLGNKVRSR